MPTLLDHIRSGLIAQGIPAFGELHGLAASNTTAVGLETMKYIDPARWYNTLAAAETAMASYTGKNDVVLVTPESHSLAAALTWDSNLTHLVGMYANARQNHRARIGHSANFSPLLTVSGYGNVFANLYFMHGRGNAANLQLLSVTGPRNSFYNCHFAGPLNATEGDQATYRILNLAHSESYFRDCTFGIDTTAWTNGDMVVFGAQADPPRVVFENCLFLMAADNAQVNFLSVAAGCGSGLALFRKCQFINIGTALTYAIDGAGLGNFKMAFDSDCYFAGCTDVVALAYEASVFLAPSNTPINQVTGGASVALFNGLAAAPDVS